MSSVEDKYRAKMDARRGVASTPDSATTSGSSVEDKYRAKMDARRKTSAPYGGAPTKQARQATWRDRVKEIGQGATFAQSDELSAGIAAGIAAGMAKLSGGDADFSDIYRDIKDAEKFETDAYRKDNAGEALALNVAGGLLTGGLLSGGKSALTGVVTHVPGGKQLLGKASTALPGALAKVKGAMPSLPAVVAGSPNAMKAINVSGQIAKAGGVAGAEGALYGVGVADTMSDIPEELVKGGLTGFGVGSAFKGLGLTGKKGLELATRRRLEKELGKGDNFIPYNVAGPETTIGKNYKNYLGRSLGGGEIRHQSLKVIKRMEKEVADSDKVFIGEVFRRSVPDGVDPSRLDMTTPQKTFAGISDFWKKESFQSVKKHMFRVDEDDLAKDIINRVDDSALRDRKGLVTGKIKDKIGDNLHRDKIPPKTKFTTDGLGGVKPNPPNPGSSGRITGDDLMEARNHYRRAIQHNATDAETRLNNAVYKKAAAAIDDRVRAQLADISPDDLVRFDDELANYRNYVTLSKAMSKAASEGDQLPTPKQILMSIGGDDIGKGRGAHQKLANAEMVKNAKLEAAVQVAKDATPPEVGGVQQIAQAGIMGAPMLSVLGPFNPASYAAAVGAGAAATKVINRPGTQRLVAGQTAAQKAGAKLLKRYEGSNTQKAGKAISTALRRGYLTDTDR